MKLLLLKSKLLLSLVPKESLTNGISSENMFKVMNTFEKGDID